MIIKIKLVILLLLLVPACHNAPGTPVRPIAEALPKSYERIVSLSGAITELLFSLELGEKVVAVDVTSTFPAMVKTLPQLGHVRNLNTEAVLALQPDLIIAEQPDEAIKALATLVNAGIEVLLLEKNHTLDNPIKMAQQLAKKLKFPAQFMAMEQSIQESRQHLAMLQAKQVDKPKVLFIYARGTGNLMVAGHNTPAAAMIELAGGINAIEGFEGFKALSTEGLLAANPDVILMFESGIQSLGGIEGLKKLPGMMETSAGKQERFIAMDGLYLLGFTPRVGAAAVELAERFLAFPPSF